MPSHKNPGLSKTPGDHSCPQKLMEGRTSRYLRAIRRPRLRKMNVVNKHGSFAKPIRNPRATKENSLILEHTKKAQETIRDQSAVCINEIEKQLTPEGPQASKFNKWQDTESVGLNQVLEILNRSPYTPDRTALVNKMLNSCEQLKQEYIKFVSDIKQQIKVGLQSHSRLNPTVLEPPSRRVRLAVKQPIKIIASPLTPENTQLMIQLLNCNPLGTITTSINKTRSVFCNSNRLRRTKLTRTCNQWNKTK